MIGNVQACRTAGFDQLEADESRHVAKNKVRICLVRCCRGMDNIPGESRSIPHIRPLSSLDDPALSGRGVFVIDHILGYGAI